MDIFMNWLNWWLIEPFWDVIDVFRWVFSSIFGW